MTFCSSDRDLTGFDFSLSTVSEGPITSLHRCEFMEESHNVIFIGGPGTGKTHLATAIGVQKIQQHHKWVRFLSTIELVENGGIDAAHHTENYLR